VFLRRKKAFNERVWFLIASKSFEPVLLLPPTRTARCCELIRSAPISGGSCFLSRVAATEGVVLLFIKGERPRTIDSSSGSGSSFIESDGDWLCLFRLLIG